MHEIYELEDKKWVLWSNKLPLPVNNNTIIAISYDNYCDNGIEYRDNEEFLSKRYIHHDRSVHRSHKRRCHPEAEVMAISGIRPKTWNNFFHTEMSLDELSCFVSNRDAFHTTPGKYYY